MPGMIVWKGRLPPATTLGCSGSSEKPGAAVLERGATGVEAGAEADEHRRDEAHRHAVGDDRGVHGVAAHGLAEVGLPEPRHVGDARIGDVRVRVLHAGADGAGDGDDIGGIVGIAVAGCARQARQRGEDRRALAVGWELQRPRGRGTRR